MIREHRLFQHHYLKYNLWRFQTPGWTKGDIKDVEHFLDKSFKNIMGICKVTLRLWCHIPRIHKSRPQLPTRSRWRWIRAHRYNTRYVWRWDVHRWRLAGRVQRRWAAERADEVRRLILVMSFNLKSDVVMSLILPLTHTNITKHTVVPPACMSVVVLLPPRGFGGGVCYWKETKLLFTLPCLLPSARVSAPTSLWWGSSSRCITLRGELVESWEKGGWCITPAPTHWWETQHLLVFIFYLSFVPLFKMQFCINAPCGVNLYQKVHIYYKFIFSFHPLPEETSLLDPGPEVHHSVPEREQHQVLQGTSSAGAANTSAADSFCFLR